MQDQRDDRMTICGDLISSVEEDPTFLNRILTGDETRYFMYDPQLKLQIRHLENVSIATMQWKKTATRQAKRQGDV